MNDSRRMFDKSAVTQPTRPDVPHSRVASAWAHIKEVADPTSNFVPVRRFRRTRGQDAWDGSYEYYGPDNEMVLCLPGFKAFNYKPFEYTGLTWSADGMPIELRLIDGAWHAIIVPFRVVTDEEIAEISQRYPIVDAGVSALP